VSPRPATATAANNVPNCSFDDAISTKMVPASAASFAVYSTSAAGVDESGAPVVSELLSSDPHAANTMSDAAAIAAIFFFIIFSLGGFNTLRSVETEAQVFHTANKKNGNTFLDVSHHNSMWDCARDVV
jgi:hypothetical protein